MELLLKETKEFFRGLWFSGEVCEEAEEGEDTQTGDLRWLEGKFYGQFSFLFPEGSLQKNRGISAAAAHCFAFCKGKLDYVVESFSYLLFLVFFWCHSIQHSDHSPYQREQYPPLWSSLNVIKGLGKSWASGDFSLDSIPHANSLKTTRSQMRDANCNPPQIHQQQRWQKSFRKKKKQRTCFSQNSDSHLHI